MREVTRVPAFTPPVPPRRAPCHWFLARGADARRWDDCAQRSEATGPTALDRAQSFGLSVDPLWLLSDVNHDRDHDGVPDTLDNCRGVFNPSQRDTDGDRLADACDFDDDNDGIPDARDPWPRERADIVRHSRADTIRHSRADAIRHSRAGGNPHREQALTTSAKTETARQVALRRAYRPIAPPVTGMLLDLMV